MAKKLSPAKSALLEKWLDGHFEGDATSIPQGPSDSPVPLSFPQQRQLFLELLDRGTAVNNLSVFLELTGMLDLTALELSANQIFVRHDVLRTRYSFGSGLPTPEVIADTRFNLQIIDLQHSPVNERESKARRLAEEEVLKPFDLAQAPLIRLQLYILGSEKYFLLLVVHHTIADGWSLGVFLKELMFFYRVNTGDKLNQLPDLQIQYADYAHWQTDAGRKKALQISMDYWKKQLDGELPVLELPTDQPRGARQTFRGGTHRFVLSTELTEALEKLNQQEDVTLFMTLLTTFYILLHRYSGQDEILVGTPVANRDLPELEQLIGVFINTIVTRIHLSNDPVFRELLKQVRDVSMEAFAYHDLPFEKLVEELKPPRDLSRTPIFQVVFNLQNSPMPTLEIPGIGINFRELDRGVSQFDLTLMISKLDGQCHATVEYNNDLFEPSTISRMFASFQLLLKDALDHPDLPISRMKVISKEEEFHVVKGLNQTQVDYPREKNVQQLFEAQTEKTPDAIAVIYNNSSISYRDLNQRANVVARHLQEMGVGPGIRVGILMERSLEIVEALLGVLKAGGVYVPINNSFPTERVQFILKDANVHLLLTNVELDSLESNKELVVNMNGNKLLTKCDGSTLRSNISPDDLAYIMYTSGSTGNPKGVMVQHFALVNFLWSMQKEPGIKKDDVLLSVTSISFDIAALELFLPLITGATLVIASREMINNPILMSEAIDRYQASIMQATPATWQLLLDTGWEGKDGLKALCGGDVLTRNLADRLLDRVGDLWNMYGPTETTIWSSIQQILDKNSPITIGHPINNTQMYVLDQKLKLVPVGVVGELHIGGDGLAKGYLDQALLTNDKFISDCYSSSPGARLYKTGDLARYLPDFSIEILGRMDDQVKIHGHRIELGEIEVVLMEYPSIREAIVITRTETSGDKRIVAYFVPENETDPEAGELRDYLRMKLPSYMIPSVFVRMEDFPLTAHGKTDRKSLPVPEDLRQGPEYLAPRNEDESILVRIWQDVLDIEQIGIHDNFFDLGGASIQSLEIVAKASIYGLKFNVEAIFEYQTIAELARQIK